MELLLVELQRKLATAAEQVTAILVVLVIQTLLLILLAVQVAVQELLEQRQLQSLQVLAA
jgi:steroid 5-alpha reductase family enzyme